MRLMTSITRHLAILLIVAFAAVSCGGGAGEAGDKGDCAQPQVKISQAVASLAFMPVYVANSEGFFEDQGLEVEQIDTAGGGPDLQALISGDVQFNAGAGTYQIDALSQGKPITNVYNYMNRNLINVVLNEEAAEAAGVTVDSPLEDKLSALEGATIGVTRPGSLTDKVAQYLVRAGGMEPQSDVKVVASGSGAVLIAALREGQVNGIAMSSPVPEQAVHDGLGIMLVNNAQGDVPQLDPFMMENIYTTQDFAEQNPGCVTKFVAAIHEANQWILDQEPEAITESLSEAFAQTDPQVLREAVVNTKAAISEDGVLTTESVENTLEMLGETSVKAEQVFDLFTNEFIPGAGSDG